MREYIDVLPNNVNQSQNVSFRDGNPLVQFRIGAQERYLLGSTIRLCGTIKVLDSDTSATPAAGKKCAIDPRLGVYSVLDQLVISSAKTSQTIEHIRNYNRFLSTYIPVTSSPNDLIGHMGISSLSSANVDASQNQITEVGSGTDTSFSITLPCGVFLGQNPIPLSNTDQ